MEPQPSTHTDGSKQGRPWGEPRDPEEDLYAGTAEESSERSGESWSARYGASPPPPPRSGPDFSALFIVLDGLRRAAPAEMQDRLTSLIREGLMALRSLIDRYLERLDRRPPEPEVERIPVD